MILNMNTTTTHAVWFWTGDQIDARDLEHARHVAEKNLLANWFEEGDRLVWDCYGPAAERTGVVNRCTVYGANGEPTDAHALIRSWC